MQYVIKLAFGLAGMGIGLAIFWFIIFPRMK